MTLGGGGQAELELVVADGPPHPQRPLDEALEGAYEGGVDGGGVVDVEDHERPVDGLEGGQAPVFGLVAQAIDGRRTLGQRDAAQGRQAGDASTHLLGLGPGAVGDDQGQGRITVGSIGGHDVFEGLSFGGREEQEGAGDVDAASVTASVISEDAVEGAWAVGVRALP